MEINLVWAEGGVVPVPLVNGLHLHTHLSGFLATRFYYPRGIRENMSPVTGGSLRQIAYDLKSFLEALVHNGIEYTEADFTDHIEKILELQLGKSNANTYNARLTRIRDFYDYLRKEGIHVKASFPARIVKKRYESQDDNFLSHTSSRRGISYESDDGQKKINLKEDYKDQVISIDKYGKLYRALKEIDPVYAVMGQVMMQTLLRIADVCEMPVHSNRYNRYIPVWPEFQRSGVEVQKYRSFTKRSKLIEIDIFPLTIQAIYEDYIEPYYQDRKELFDSVYMKRKNATLEFGNIRDLGRRSCPENILWLTASGAPVKPYMVESAFRETGLDVHPHMLRHSGSTHMLWNYCRIYNIEPDIRFAPIFMDVLRDQLGHASLEVTRMYVRTINRLKARRTMPFVIPNNKAIIDERLSGIITQNINDEMARFFEFRVENIKTDAFVVD
jgi:site-specific recombinase XerD